MKLWCKVSASEDVVSSVLSWSITSTVLPQSTDRPDLVKQPLRLHLWSSLQPSVKHPPVFVCCHIVVSLTSRQLKHHFVLSFRTSVKMGAPAADAASA